MKFRNILLLIIFIISLFIVTGCLEKEDTSLIDIKIIGLEYGKLKKGETYKLTAQKYYGNGTVEYGNVTWASTNSTIIRVDDEGTIKALEITTSSPIIITAKEDRLVGIKEIYVLE